tara:strand:+ start:1467 stop:1640 length:174 start_codon:yes stop_codon:yes gene_type:complete
LNDRLAPEDDVRCANDLGAARYFVASILERGELVLAKDEALKKDLGRLGDSIVSGDL